MVHTPKGPVASGLGEAEVTLDEAVVEAGEVSLTGQECHLRPGIQRGG